MLTFNTIYQLDAPIVKCVDYPLSGWWIPEVQEWSSGDDEVLSRIDNASLVQLKLIGYGQGDGDRYAQLISVWYNGYPVMIIQEAGRSGRDHRKRWVTDEIEYKAMCNYIRSLITMDFDLDDVVDPNTAIYPELVFNFYGCNFGKNYGIEPEERHSGYLILRNGRDGSFQFIKDADPEHLLIAMTNEVKDVPEYVRREGFVMKQVREITEAEYNSHEGLANLQNQKGPMKYFWYEQVERPTSAVVVSI